MAVELDQLLRSADLPHVRELARTELAARLEAEDGCGDVLYGLCFVLYLVGEADDVRLIDEIKHSCFDCGALIDRDLYQMRRTRAEMLAVASDPRLAARIIEAFEAPNFETPAAFEAALRDYFGIP